MIREALVGGLAGILLGGCTTVENKTSTSKPTRAVSPVVHQQSEADLYLQVASTLWNDYASRPPQDQDLKGIQQITDFLFLSLTCNAGAGDASIFERTRDMRELYSELQHKIGGFPTFPDAFRDWTGARESDKVTRILHAVDCE